MSNSAQFCRENALYKLLGVILFMIPLLHLGFSYYISAQVFGFLSMAFLVMFSKVERRAVIVASVCGFLYIVKLLAVVDTSETRDILVVIREMACFVLLLLAIHPISMLCRKDRVSKLYYLFLSIVAVFVFVQYVAIHYGVFISFPNDWFVMNKGTLEGVDLAVYHESRIRPTGFYGEPSYMAFILVSAFIVFLSYEVKWKKILGVAALNFMVLAFLGSLSGFLAFLLVSIIFFFSQLSAQGGTDKLKLFGVVFVLFFLVSSVLFLQDEFIDRLSSFLSDDIDPSSYIRFVGPYLIFLQMINDGAWLGYSSSEMQILAENYGIDGINNALFYLLLHYGIVSAFLLVFFLASYVRYAHLIAYVLIVLNFNGAYFSFDKTIVMALVLGFSIGLVNSASSKKLTNFSAFIEHDI